MQQDTSYEEAEFKLIQEPPDTERDRQIIKN